MDFGIRISESEIRKRLVAGKEGLKLYESRRKGLEVFSRATVVVGPWPG